MDQFAQAKLKSEKRRESLARSVAKKPQEVVSKKVEAPKPAHEPGPMVLKISGPVEMTLLVDYAGTLLNSQQQEDVLRAMFKKALLPIGKVR